MTEESDWCISDEYDGYEQELAKFAVEFPGWWLTGGVCSISCHCTIGPDAYGPDAALLSARQFDSGFDADIEQPTRMAVALRSAMDLARVARADQLANAPEPTP